MYTSRDAALDAYKLVTARITLKEQKRKAIAEMEMRANQCRQLIKDGVSQESAIYIDRAIACNYWRGQVNALIEVLRLLER